MAEAPHHEEPVYPPAAGEPASSRRRPLLIGLGVLLAIAGALLAVAITTNDDDGAASDDARSEAVADDDSDRGDAGSSATAEPGDPTDAEMVMLVPGDVLLDRWEIVAIDEGPLFEEVGEALVVVPAGHAGNLGAAVLIEVLPFDSIGDDRPVTVGRLTGTYEATNSEGLARLDVGDGERSLALLAAGGTPLDTLRDAASRIAFDIPIEDVDPGPDWDVIVTSAVRNHGHGYTVELVSIDGNTEVDVSSWSGVDSAAVELLDLPFLSEPIDVRGSPGISISAWDDRLQLSWLEAPGLLMWLSAIDETGSARDLESLILNLADELIGVDETAWDSFVEQHPVDWRPSYTTTTTEGPTSGQSVGTLANGDEFTVVSEQGLLCVFVGDHELGCDAWPDGDDLMRPAVAELGDEDAVVFGPLPEGVEMVVVTWNDSLSESAITGQGFWAAAVPADRQAFAVKYWTDVRSNSPRSVGSAMREGDSWMVAASTR